MKRPTNGKMFLPLEDFKSLSTGEKKTAQRLLVAETFAETPEAQKFVINAMKERNQAWCVKHGFWHTLDVHTWTFPKFPNCPPPVRVPSELPSYAEGAEGEMLQGADATGQCEQATEQRADGGEQQGDKSEQVKGSKDEQGCDDHMAKSSEDYCRQRTDDGFICTKPKGHEGDHVAHYGNEREVRRWPQHGQKWKRKLFNRCPECHIDTCITVLMPPPVPPAEDQLDYTEKPCGCKILRENGIA